LNFRSKILPVSAGPPVTKRIADWSRYWGTSFASRFCDVTASSDGLTITQFPAEIAANTGARANTNGKFQVPITKATPRGSFRIRALPNVPSSH